MKFIKNKLGSIIIITTSYISLYLIYFFSVKYNFISPNGLVEILLIPASLIFSLAPIFCINNNDEK